jgi:hypothetical protein
MGNLEVRVVLQVFSVADEDGDQSGEGEEEKDAVTYCISNEVHFTNPKMSRYNLSDVIRLRKDTHFVLQIYFNLKSVIVCYEF